MNKQFWEFVKQIIVKKKITMCKPCHYVKNHRQYIQKEYSSYLKENKKIGNIDKKS